MKLYQRGHKLLKHQGQRYQRGLGWGDFFGKVWKVIKPALAYLGHEAVKTAKNIGNDIYEGKSVLQSIVDRTYETGNEIADKIDDKLTQWGQGRVQIGGRRRISKKRKPPRKRPKSIKRGRKTGKVRKSKTNRRAKPKRTVPRPRYPSLLSLDYVKQLREAFRK